MNTVSWFLVMKMYELLMSLFLIEADCFIELLSTWPLLFIFCSLEANAGALTNFEVLDFLRSRGAGRDPTRVIVPIVPSEFKVGSYNIKLLV